MALLPLDLPPGIVRPGTPYQAKGRWYDGTLVRWHEGALQPVGGWSALAGTDATKVGGPVRGMLAWRLSNAEKRSGYMKREANDSLLALADSSLRLATRYGADTPGYFVDLGRFYLTSNSASVRGRATLEEAADQLLAPTGSSSPRIAYSGF